MFLDRDTILPISRGAFASWWSEVASILDCILQTASQSASARDAHANAPLDKERLASRTRGAVPLMAVLLLCGCATSPKLAALPLPYVVTGSVGLVVTPDPTPIRVRMPVNELAVHIEEDAEAKGKEARQSAFQLGAIAILSAPLAIFLPLDPLLISPVVELAPHTMQAGEQASRLKEQAAQMRRDAACAMRPGYVDVAEDLRRALAEQAMRRAIVEELSDALSRRTRLPVTLVDAPPPTDLGTDSFPFVEQARAQGLPSVVSVEIVALDLSPEAIGVESTSCRYKVTASAELTWWDVDRHTLVGTKRA